MLKNGLVIILFLSCAASMRAQGYTTVKTTNDKAKSAFLDGKKQSEVGASAIALGYFEDAIKKDPKFIDAYFALADTYIDQNDFFKAERFFEAGLTLDSVFAPVAFFFLAQTEWVLDKHTECAQHAASYLRTNPKSLKYKGDAERLVASAKFAAHAMANPVPFNPKSVGAGVNTREEEYFPSLTADGQTLIFTRRANENEDFYSSTNQNQVWQTAEPIKDINTNLNEGAQAISPDGTWMVFTACNRENDGSHGRCDLYWSQDKNGGWTKPTPFSNVINSSEWDSQPTIGADNKTLIFTSNRPGTKGKFDLWQTNKLGGKWGKPERLAAISTGGYEHNPFLHPDGQTLYFSSDSLPGMGGNDIFVARRKADGTWGNPQNLGYPINTKGEEGMLVVSLDGRTAYYGSDRPGGAGGYDIYAFDLPEAARPKPVTYARVKVTDASTGYPIVAKIDFMDLKKGESYTNTTTKSNGMALVCIPAGKDYGLNVTKKNYLFYSENFNLTETSTFAEPYTLNITLQPIGSDTSKTSAPKVGKPVVLRNVFFETAESVLLPASMQELDRLVDLLNDSPNLRIQINGHTDNVGNDAGNQTLSEARAKSVYQYLIDKKISVDRLRFKGFGETRPMDTNETAAGRSQNRRTEFEVVGN